MFSDIFDTMDRLFDNSFFKNFPTQVRKTIIPASIPTIQKVVEKFPKTTVFFTDGTKSSVSCSKDDTPNLEVAILYAIVKRIYGTVDRTTGEATLPSLGKTIRRATEELTFHATSKATPEKTKIPVVCAPKTISPSSVPEKPVSTPCRKSVPSKTISRIAQKLKKTFPLPAVQKTTTTSSSISNNSYVRPSKPFSKFSQEEKRAYWRWQKAKSRKS